LATNFHLLNEFARIEFSKKLDRLDNTFVKNRVFLFVKIRVPIKNFVKIRVFYIRENSCSN